MSAAPLWPAAGWTAFPIDPRELAAKLDGVALSVNYLQSGKADAIDGPEPYDFGYLQALDALRAGVFPLKTGDHRADTLLMRSGSRLVTTRDE